MLIFFFCKNENAKNSFIRMTGFEPDDSDIIRIKNIQETDQSFFYELLNSFLENNNNINELTEEERMKLSEELNAQALEASGYRAVDKKEKSEQREIK